MAETEGERPTFAMPGASTEAAPVLSVLDAPAIQRTISLAGPPVPPQHRLYFYSSDEWELFIREWATGLETQYQQIKLLGGPGDRGVDVAGFKTVHGFEGAWDCFQGKHYANPLGLSDVVPEILKTFAHAVLGHYLLPDRYAFLAPQGCGSTLNRLLSAPTDLQTEFMKRLKPDSSLAKGIAPEALSKIRELAGCTDFAMFESVEILDALEVHRKTPYFPGRFGSQLLPRPVSSAPPEDVAKHESRYIAQLAAVYEEKHPGETFEHKKLATHPQVGKHFQRQRISFYSAEALRLYARDSVPDGTFQALQNDVHAGVIEVAESEHPTGLERLAQVLTASTQLDLSSHTLVSVANLEDRKGICHQLANEDRLSWMSPET
ncbi:ABC-three component system protein [Mycobacteroides chelonae]